MTRTRLSWFPLRLDSCLSCFSLSWSVCSLSRSQTAMLILSILNCDTHPLDLELQHSISQSYNEWTLIAIHFISNPKPVLKTFSHVRVMDSSFQQRLTLSHEFTMVMFKEPFSDCVFLLFKDPLSFDLHCLCLALFVSKNVIISRTSPPVSLCLCVLMLSSLWLWVF